MHDTGLQRRVVDANPGRFVKVLRAILSHRLLSNISGQLLCCYVRPGEVPQSGVSSCH